MDANNINMVAVGLEELGVEDFITGKFFDGGELAPVLRVEGVVGWVWSGIVGASHRVFKNVVVEERLWSIIQ